MKKLRALAASATALALSFGAQVAPAMANIADAGDEPGPGMSVVETLGIFVVLPIAVVFVIWLLWAIPGWRAKQRPATGENWNPTPNAQ